MNVQTKPAAAVRNEGMRIAGKRIDLDERIEVRNPYNGAVVGTVPAARAEHVRAAFAKAAAYKSKLTRYERQQILLRTADLLRDRKEDFARIITAESGLCWKDSLYEAGRAYDVYSFAGQLTIKDDGEIYSCDISPQSKMRKIFTMRTPLRGVISAITPFNHPLNMVSHKLAPAIATNNRVVLKPTELTPLTALALADVLYEAGLPPEMLSVVTGNPSTMGDAMITDPDCDLITFTGSVKVGKYIAEKAGYRRIVLELGGNDPLIVMEDADLDKAAELAVAGATKNSGQRCTAVKRILVVEKVADEFSRLVLEKAKKLKSGDPMDPDDRRRHGDPRRCRQAVRTAGRRRGREGGRSAPRQQKDRCAIRPDGCRQGALRLRACAPGDLWPGHSDHTLPQRHRGSHSHLEFDRVRPVLGRLHLETRIYHPLHRRVGGGDRQYLGSARLSDRNVAIWRDQGFRAGLQGRGGRSHEELHQRKDLFSPLVQLNSVNRGGRLTK